MQTAAMAQPPTSPTQYYAGAPAVQPFMARCDLPLAMAWFGDQKYGTTYNPEDALERGTLFPELDKPWLAPQRRTMQ